MGGFLRRYKGAAVTFAQWNRSAGVQAYLYDNLELPETQNHPRLPRTGESDKHRQVPWVQSLAEAVIETALREALGDYSDSSKTSVNKLAKSEAKAFFESDDCLPWIELAGKDMEAVDTVRDMIRSGVKVAV